MNFSKQIHSTQQPLSLHAKEGRSKSFNTRFHLLPEGCGRVAATPASCPGVTLFYLGLGTTFYG